MLNRDDDFKHNPFRINGRNAAAIDAPDQLEKAATSHDAYLELCATTYARSSLSASRYLLLRPIPFQPREMRHRQRKTASPSSNKKLRKNESRNDEKPTTMRWEPVIRCSIRVPNEACCFGV